MTTIERSATRMMAWLLCAVAAVGMASATTAVAADTVLVIGATGGTGLRPAARAAKSSSRPKPKVLQCVLWCATKPRRAKCWAPASS